MKADTITNCAAFCQTHWTYKCIVYNLKTVTRVSYNKFVDKLWLHNTLGTLYYKSVLWCKPVVPTSKQWCFSQKYTISFKHCYATQNLLLSPSMVHPDMWRLIRQICLQLRINFIMYITTLWPWRQHVIFKNSL